MKSSPPSDSSDLELFDVGGAVSFLRGHLAESDGYWANFLLNNRRPNRRPSYRIPFAKLRGIVVYKREELAKFVEFEKLRRLSATSLTGRSAQVMHAFGIGTKSGGLYGRRFEWTLTEQSNESGRFAQLQVHDPLLVFRLSPEEVESLAMQFSKLSQRLKRYEKS